MLRFLRNVLLGVMLGTGIYTLTSCALFSKPTKTQAVTNEALSLMADKELFPSIVALSENGNNFCSGIVISDTEVLTAAHCVVINLGFMMMPRQNFEVTSLVKGNAKAVSPAKVYALNGRSDIAIITGDFRLFKKQKINTSPDADILANTYELATCGFPGGGPLACYTLHGEFKQIDMIGFRIGQMYAGMSGGPVIDLNTGIVYAVNHAVSTDQVIVAPIVNLFESVFVVE